MHLPEESMLRTQQKSSNRAVLAHAGALALTAIACSSSSLQPVISDRGKARAAETPSFSSGQGTGVDPEPPPPSEVTCERTAGHNVYYANTVVELTFTCDAELTEIALVDAPAFL